MIPLDMAERTAAPDGRPMAEQPAWRRDFPIDLPQDQYVARRDFTRFMMLTSMACAVGQVLLGVRNWLHGRPVAPTAQPIARADEIPVGGVKPFLYPDAGGPCLLLRPDAQTPSGSARNAPTSDAPSCRMRRKSSSFVHAIRARSTRRRAGRWRGRRAGRCRASPSKTATAFSTRSAWKNRRPETGRAEPGTACQRTVQGLTTNRNGARTHPFCKSFVCLPLRRMIGEKCEWRLSC